VLEYQGIRLTIRYCEQPPQGVDPSAWSPPSWDQALAHIPAKKHGSIFAKMLARQTILADKAQLRSPDHWNTEGETPDGKRFYAIKVDKIRAYGWFSIRHKGVFFISHFAFKKGQKLASSDANRVIANWRKFEEQQP
jgi:hypothetical protein